MIGVEVGVEGKSDTSSLVWSIGDDTSSSMSPRPLRGALVVVVAVVIVVVVVVAVAAAAEP